MNDVIETVVSLVAIGVGFVVSIIPTVFYIYGIFAFRQYLGL